MSVNGKKWNKEVLAWSMYDFANQPFTTLTVSYTHLTLPTKA